MLRSIVRKNVLSVALAVNRRSFSKDRLVIPKEFGEELSRLFKSGKYLELISKIDSSPYTSNPALLEFKAFSQELLSEEFRLRAQQTRLQAEYFLNKESDKKK